MLELEFSYSTFKGQKEKHCHFFTVHFMKVLLLLLLRPSFLHPLVNKAAGVLNREREHCSPRRRMFQHPKNRECSGTAGGSVATHPQFCFPKGPVHTFFVSRIRKHVRWNVKQGAQRQTAKQAV